jgi:Zn-dependent protease with chaperone function
MRMIWTRLEAIFELQPRWGSGVIRAFFRWYIPYFSAVSFPFARTNEYEADSAAVMVTSARGAAQALTGVHIIGSYFEKRYWPAMYAAAKDSPRREVAPFSGFIAQAVREIPEADLKGWLAAALSQPTTHADTHPSLTDRLKAIGAPAELVPPAPREGAERLLGRGLARLEKKFDTAWSETVMAHERRAPFPAELLTFVSARFRGA